MEYTISNNSSNGDPRYDAWFEEERASSEDFDIESDVDDVDYDNMEDEYDE